MSKLGDVLGGGQGLKSHAGETITVSAFDVEEDDEGREAVAIQAANGSGEFRTRTTSGVVIKQLYALKAEDLLPATVRVDLLRSRGGRDYLSLAEPDDNA